MSVTLPPHHAIFCTRHHEFVSKGKKHSGNGKEKKEHAKVACLSCSRYLCKQCDHEAHASAPANKHHRFPVGELQSFIVFDGRELKGESHIRRSLSAQSGPFVAPSNKATTLYDNFQYSVRKFPNRPCLGERVVGNDGQIGPYVWQSYKQVSERALRLGAALAHLGVTPKSCVGVYSANRPEWVIADQALHAFSLVSVPLYDTLGPDAAEVVMKQSGCVAVVCGADKLDAVLRLAPSLPTLKVVVVMPNRPFEKPLDLTKALSGASNSGVRVLTMQQAEELGSANPRAPLPPSASDMATMCYTSGTTGAPKGAMLSHQNMLAASSAAQQHGVLANPDDVHISFLPLAHMFERLVHSLLLGSGSAIGFARGDPLLLMEDVETLRPTIFVGVPRLYNRLYDKVLSAMSSSGGLKAWLFNKGLAAKKENLLKYGEVTHWFWDRLIFGKIAAKLGGRVRIAITGSAPIGSDVLHFLRIAFSCAVIEGYGQTENGACSTVGMPNDQISVGTVGVPIVCNDVKLVDVPEMGYTASDCAADGTPAPRGEICMRGPNVFLGYYQNPEQTTEALDGEGWLHSGDIGVWLPNGTLKIIDRKKNIFKLSQGEYIAPEKIEQIYQRCKLVAQIFVYGDSLQSSLVAVVVPDEEEVKLWAQQHKINGSFAELVSNPALLKAVNEEMRAVGTEAKLRGFEVAKAVHLHPELFSIDNGLLTPTLKLKRDLARKVFAKQIADMYEQIAAADKPIKSKL